MEGQALYSRRQKSYELQTWRRAAYEVPCLSKMNKALVGRKSMNASWLTTGGLASGLLGAGH